MNKVIKEQMEDITPEYHFYEAENCSPIAATIKVFSLLTAIAAFSACSNDDLTEISTSNTGTSTITFRATMEGNDDESRTSIASDGTSIVWNEGDAISIFRISARDSSPYKMTLSSGEGTKNATFSGSFEPVTKYYALYPYCENDYYEHKQRVQTEIRHTWNGATQTAVPGSFPKNTPMVAYAGVYGANDVVLKFKNICSFVKVTTNYPCSAITLTAKDVNHALASDKLWTGIGDLDLPVYDISGFEATNTVTLSAGEGENLAPGTYYIAVLPGEMTGGFDLTFTNTYGDRTWTKSTTKTVTFVRSEVLNLGELDIKSELVKLVGSGTSENPYLIRDYDQLCRMRDLINIGNSPYYNAYYKQTADIDGGGATFTPIGTVAGDKLHRFNGTYDGDGHTIKNIKTTTASAPNQDITIRSYLGRSTVKDCYTTALFAFVLDATIKNLTVEDMDLSDLEGTGNERCYIKSSLIGIAYGSDDSSKKTRIENVTIRGNQTVSGSCYCYLYGGLVAVSKANLDIVNCTNYTSINNTNVLAHEMTLGGIVGVIQSSQYKAHINIDKCRNYGDFILRYLIDQYQCSKIGGIVGVGVEEIGYSTDIIPNIKNCVNFGNLSSMLVMGANPSLGGIVGDMDSDGYNSAVPYVQNCINNGSLYLENDYVSSGIWHYVGGIVGDDYSNDTHINYCANLGEISYIIDKSNKIKAGTIVAGSGSLDHCYDYSTSSLGTGGGKNSGHVGKGSTLEACIEWMNSQTASNRSTFCAWKYAEGSDNKKLDLDF